ncbi:hypothetical protein KDA23_04205, partial [Candidatus Saccharibacteria bacterium]|nr:hypothetical protein [Candidatus Saccharibacteria bacterium]
MHIFTDDTLWLDAAHTVVAKHNIEANGAFVIRNFNLQQPTGSQIWDDRDLHIVTDDYLYLDAPKRVITRKDLKVGGDLYVAGDSTFDNLDLNGEVDIAGATFKGNFLPAADSTYDLGSSTAKWRDLYLSGNTINLESGAATLSYDGTASILEIKGTGLSVGDATSGGEVASSAEGDLFVASGLKVGDTNTPNDFTQYADGTLYVVGASEYDGAARFDGAVNTNSDFNANGAVALGDGGDTVAINSSDWDISATGDATGLGSVTMDGNFSQTGTGTFSTGTGAVSLNGATTVSGNLLPGADSTYDLGSSSAKWRDLYLSGNTINLESGAATISYDTTATALELKGALVSVGDAAGASFVSGAGDLLVTGGFEVIGGVSLDSGATIFGGLTNIGLGTYTLADGDNDLGIDGDLEVNAATDLGTTLTVGGLTTLNGGITADAGVFTVADTSGNVHTSGTLDVDGTSNFDGDVTLTGATTDLAVGGALTVTGLTTLNGGITADGGVFTVADTSGNIHTGGTLDVIGTS